MKNHFINFLIRSKPGITGVITIIFLYCTTLLNAMPKSVVLYDAEIDGEWTLSAYHSDFYQSYLSDDKLQQRIIAGKVTDSLGTPLPGATIIEKGTKNGTTTDKKGFFSLQLKGAKEKIEVSHIGYTTRTVDISGKTTVSIVLRESRTTIGEVVVTGFSDKPKESFTGSAIAITGEELLSLGYTNVLQNLDVLVPGLEILPNKERGSDPNTRPEILIRGRSSFEGSSNVPTFIVDGVEVSLNYVFDMDMNEIKKITVLKDASSAALYGARGANGVIVIESKRPKKGALKVSYNFDGQLYVPDLSSYDLLNASEKLKYERLAGLYKSSTSGEEQYRLDEVYNKKFKEIQRGVDSYWLAAPLRNPVSQNHSVGIYGGGERTTYRLSARYNNTQGVMKKSYRNRYTLGFTLSHNVEKKITFTNSLYVTGVGAENSPYGSFRDYSMQNPYDRIRNENGTYNKELSYNHINPLLEATLANYDITKGNNILNNLNIRWFILPELRLESTFGFSRSKSTSNRYVSPHSQNRNKEDGFGYITEIHSLSKRYTGRLMFNYSKDLKNSSLFYITAGINTDISKSKNLLSKGEGLFSDKTNYMFFARYPNVNGPTGGASNLRSLGFFTNANYIYESRYFLDVSYRTEGSSIYGSNNRFAPLWTGGLGWNIHKEHFMPKDIFGTLKLRASAGYLGNIQFNPYQALTSYRYSTAYRYLNAIGAMPITIGNPDLKWEKTLTYNLGLDIVAISGRFDFTVDVYKKSTDNVLVRIIKPPSVGISQSIENLGEIENTGIELRGRISLLKTRNIHWRINFVASHNKNKIIKISDYLKKLNEEANKKTKSIKAFGQYEEGQSLTILKVVPSGGIDPATGKEMYIKKDGTVTYIYDYKDKVIVGDRLPKLYGSLSTSLQYKGFSFSTYMSYRLGATHYNSTLASRVEGADPTRNADQRVFDSRWKKPDDVVLYKNIADRSTPYQTDRFVQDEYRLALRSIRIGYQLKRSLCKKIGLQSLRFSVFSNNVFVWSTIKEEVGLSYPYARNYQLSINTTF